LPEKKNKKIKVNRATALKYDPAGQLLEKPKHWGVKDASEKVDEALYGC
jgi:hypothetical protein